MLWATAVRCKKMLQTDKELAGRQTDRETNYRGPSYHCIDRTAGEQANNYKVQDYSCKGLH